MNISNLKGQKKLEAIEQMGNDIEYLDTLLELAQSEKGTAKTLVMEALAKFNTPKTNFLWEKMLKSKSKGELVLMPAISDSISDLIAEPFYDFLVKLFQNADGYELSEKEFRELKLYTSLMLGKASDKMLEIYRLVAKNADKFASFKIISPSVLTATPKDLQMNDFLKFKNVKKSDKYRIFSLVLACSIIRNQDARLIHLADELAEKYGKNWFSPKFLSDILTKNKAEVFEKYSPWLKSDEALYLFDILGLTFFSRRKYQESDQSYNSRKKHQMVARWGDYEYGQIDSRRMFECPFEGYDERWLVALTEAKQPKISLQIYFRGRGGVLYDAFDEMLGQNIPKEFENESVKKHLQTYFQQKETQSNGQSTLYIDMLNFLDVPISEEMLRKHIDCKENAVSEYNILPLLNNETQWTKEQKLAFYATLPPKLVNKDELKKLQSEK